MSKINEEIKEQEQNGNEENFERNLEKTVIRPRDKKDQVPALKNLQLLIEEKSLIPPPLPAESEAPKRFSFADFRPKIRKSEIKEDIQEKGPKAALIYEKIGLDKIKRLYYLTIIALLTFQLVDYYNIVSPYLSFRGDEALITYAAFLVVLYVLGVRFFQYFVPKLKSRVYLLLLFLIPSTFIEMATETYQENAKYLTSFDNWFDYYHQAKIYYSVGNLKKSQIMVKNSIQKLQVNSNTGDKVLFFKSILYSARVEARIGDKRKALNAFTNVSHFLGKMSFFALSLDNVILNQEMASLYNQLGDHSKAMDAATKSLQIMSKMLASSNPNLILEIKSHPELQHFALFEKIISGIHLLKDKGAGEDEELREDQIKAIKEDWAKVEDFYFSVIERNRFLKKEKILQLVNLMNLFKDKAKEDDASLELALKILNYVRDDGMEDELLAVYIAIADIYDRKGLKAKSEVYIKLLQESGVSVEREEGNKTAPSDPSPQLPNEGAIPSDEQNKYLPKS